jgi:hypothetical protein
MTLLDGKLDHRSPEADNVLNANQQGLGSACDRGTSSDHFGWVMFHDHQDPRRRLGRVWDD